MSVNDVDGRRPGIHPAAAAVLALATLVGAGAMFRVFPSPVSDTLRSEMARLISVMAANEVPPCPKPATETPGGAGETSAASPATSLQALTAPARSTSRAEVPPTLNSAHRTMHGMPRWQARSTAPRYLVIRLMATPKNHRSPPAVA